MTVRLEDVPFRKRAMVRRATKQVRAYHSEQADEELNEVLPEAEKAFDKLVAKGIVPGDAEIDQIIARSRTKAVTRLKAVG